MKKLSDNALFSKKEALTPEELDAYFNASLSPEQQRVIEHKITDDDFNADAFDGYAANKEALNELEPLKDMFQEKVLSQARKFNIKKLVLGSGIAIIAISTLLYMGFPARSPHKNPSPGIPVQNSENTLENFILTEEDVLYEEEYVPQKQYEETKTIDTETAAPVAEEGFVKQDPILLALPESVHIVNEAQETRLIHSRKPALPFKYILQYKVINYAGRQNSYFRNPHTSQSLSPQFENIEAKKAHQLSEQRRGIPYEIFLEQALTYYKKQQYKEAIDHFQLIRSQYSEDGNALFYGALAYYHSGLNREAIQSFNSLLNAPYAVFDQEATFYLALSYLEEGEEEDANRYLQQIVNANGFYAERAKKLLR